MMDGRWWWMTQVLGLLTLTAAVFTWLGWRLHVVLAEKKKTPLSDRDSDLSQMREKASILESRLHEAEGALRRSEAELVETRMTLNHRSDVDEEEDLRLRLHQAESKLKAIEVEQLVPLVEPAPQKDSISHQMMPRAVSLSHSTDELRHVELERDQLKAGLELLKACLDRAAEFRQSELEGDDLTRIRGVGKALAARLNAFGVFTFGQIAAWSEEELTMFGKWMGFGERLNREDWQGQCRRMLENRPSTQALDRSAADSGVE